MKDKLILAFKKFVYYHFSVFSYRGKKASESVSEITKQEEQIFEGSKYTVGIVKEKWHLHSSYIKACKELNISYDNEEAHSAAYDAMVTAEVFCKIINDYDFNALSTN